MPSSLLSAITLLASYGLVSSTLPGAAVAQAAGLNARGNPDDCNQDNVLRCLLNSDDIATPYCSSYLGIRPATKTITVKASTSTNKKTTTTTTSTTTATPLECISDYPRSRISSACSCLSIPTSTKTVTKTSSSSTTAASITKPATTKAVPTSTSRPSSTTKQSSSAPSSSSIPPASAPAGAIYVAAPSSYYDKSYGFSTPDKDLAIFMGSANQTSATKSFALTSDGKLTKQDGKFVAVQGCNDPAVCGDVSNDPDDGDYAIYFADASKTVNDYYIITCTKSEAGKLSCSQQHRPALKVLQVCDFFETYAFINLADKVLEGCRAADLYLI